MDHQRDCFCVHCSSLVHDLALVLVLLCTDDTSTCTIFATIDISYAHLHICKYKSQNKKKSTMISCSSSGAILKTNKIMTQHEKTKHFIHSFIHSKQQYPNIPAIDEGSHPFLPHTLTTIHQSITITHKIFYVMIHDNIHSPIQARMVAHTAYSVRRRWCMNPC